jgi:transposase
MAAKGRHTLEDLARLLDRSRSTIQTWLDKFHTGGLDGLLERNSPPGTVSPIARPKIRAQLVTGLKSGRWTSALQVASWLKQTHGICRSRKSMYYWIGKIHAAD